MYRSYSVNDMPQPARRTARADYAAQKPPPEEKNPRGEAVTDRENRYNNDRDEKCEEQDMEERCEQPCGARPETASPPPMRAPAQCGPPAGARQNGGFLANIKSDDIIIIAVILILLMDGCDDKLLIAALGIILFSDYFSF